MTSETTARVRLVGGPLDGQEHEGLDGDGAWLVVDGWEARADYGPMPGTDPAVWWYLGQVWA